MLKAAKATILILLLITPALAQRSARFDPDGSFWLVGDPPPEFSEFSAINLNAKRLRRLPSAGLQINDGTNYRFKTLTVKRNNFSFTTMTRGGVTYSFSGKFLRGGVYAEMDLDDTAPILEGTLTKFRGGKRIAEANLKFSYFGGT